MLFDLLPSTTASFVALFRGVYSQAPTNLNVARDGYARQMLPLGLRVLHDVLVNLWRNPRLAQTVLRYGTLGFGPHVALRTVAIDRWITDFFSDQSTQRPQLVVLGAGFDARAYRLSALHSSAVFEVDHPATQRTKRQKLGQNQTLAAELEYVSVDFERQQLDEELARHGHSVDRPTLWLWEGVTMYLEKEAVIATLDRLSKRSTVGSKLVLTYVIPELFVHSNVFRKVLYVGATVIGEAVKGAMSSEDMHELLHRFGFRVLADQDTTELAKEYWPEQNSTIWPRERVLLAEKTLA